MSKDIRHHHLVKSAPRLISAAGAGTVIKIRSVITLLCCALVAAIPAQAADPALPNERSAYVGALATLDSNALRLDNDDQAEAVIGEADREDLITEVFGGGALNVRSNRREIELSAHAFRREFSNARDFSHTGGRAVAAVQWEDIGLNRFGAAYRFDRRQRDYINQLPPDEDLRTRHAVQGFFGRKLSLAVDTEATVEVAEIGFDQATDLDQQQLRLGWQLNYQTRQENRIGVRAEYVDGDFDSGDERNFDELLIGPTVRWLVTPRTVVEAELNYKERNQDDPIRSEFSGITGRFDLVRRTNSEGTRYRLSLRREISNLQDEIDDFAVITRIALEPEWQLSAKRRLSLVAAVERRDFRSESAFAIAGTSSREDDLMEVGLTYLWNPTDQLEFEGRYRHFRRDSNLGEADFDSNAVTAGIRWLFR